jgi:arylsulfatase A-like enzyme
VPLQCYLDLYADEEIDLPYYGDWHEDNIYPVRNLTYPSKAMNCYRSPDFQPRENRIRAIRRAFYAQCTHIDHQLRLVIGTLREEGLLDNTILLFTCDHGDMLGNHRMWAKRVFYENSAHVPMLLSSLPGDNRVAQGVVDNRLVGLQDVMPTLLDLCNIPVPESVDGLSMVGDTTRDWLYGEINEDELASRMVHDGRYKLIYYPVGNYAQLFDLQDDPNELRNLAGQSGIQKIQETLTQILMSQLYNGDEAWIQNGQLVGLPDKLFEPKTNRGLHGQRGGHWPPPSYTPEAFA